MKRGSVCTRLHGAPLQKSFIFVGVEAFNVCLRGPWVAVENEYLVDQRMNGTIILELVL